MNQGALEIDPRFHGPGDEEIVQPGIAIRKFPIMRPCLALVVPHSDVFNERR